MNASELPMCGRKRETWASSCMILFCLMLSLPVTSQALPKKRNHDPVSKWSFALEAGPAFGGSSSGIEEGLIDSGYGDDRVASAHDGWFGPVSSKSFPYKTAQLSAMLKVGYRIKPNCQLEYHFGKMQQAIIKGYDASTARYADISYQLTGGGVQLRLDGPHTPFSVAFGPVLARHRVREYEPYPFDRYDKPDYRSWVAGVKAGIGMVIWKSRSFRVQFGAEHMLLSSVWAGPLTQSDGGSTQERTFFKRKELKVSHTRCFLSLGLTPGKRIQ